MLPSPQPPRGLVPSAVPQFLSIGWDDNGFSGLPGSGSTGALAWAMTLTRGRKNPPGEGNARNYDGAPLSMSFYLTSAFATRGRDEDPRYVRRAWEQLLAEGHELGNHTVSHDDGSAFDEAAWRAAISACNRDLTALGLLSEPTTLGFRTPYLRYNDATFAAVSALGFRYDCSIEEGFQDDQDGTNFLWPYRLDAGSPGHDIEAERAGRPKLTPRPGLWEMPAYAVIVPPDDECERYGVRPGLRARLKEVQDYFDERDGKITGFDYNLWVCFRMTPAEFVATLSYTLDLRLRGNRAPFLFGAHSDYYSPKYTDVPNATVGERQAAMEQFVAYALSKPEVRMVSTQQVLAWITRTE